MALQFQNPESAQNPVPNAVLCLFGASVILGVLAALVASLADPGPSYYFTSISLAAVIGPSILLALPNRLPHEGFGRANCITLVRAVLTCLLAGGIGLMAHSDALVWILVAIAALALVLDGVDGWLARKLRECTDFGARFDLEIDALFLLIVSILVYELDKAGAWIVIPGILRYAHLALAYFWPALALPLPPSRRRKVIYVVFASLMIACLSPVVPPEVSSWLALVGVSVLVLSFAVDITWQIHRAATGPAGGLTPRNKRIWNDAGIRD